VQNGWFALREYAAATRYNFLFRILDRPFDLEKSNIVHGMVEPAEDGLLIADQGVTFAPKLARTVLPPSSEPSVVHTILPRQSGSEWPRISTLTVKVSAP
jgi:hypothetical protein